MNTIKLYRGDSTKIPEFNVKKTSNGSLLGAGIYLTDSTKVANTYRRKDTDIKYLTVTYERNPIDGKGLVPFNRDTVLEDAFGRWLEKKFPNEVGYCSRIRNKPHVVSKALEQYKLTHRAQWQDMIGRQKVRATYLGKDTIVVEEKPDNAVGYTSVFEFFSEEFEPAIIKVDGRLKDQGFIDFAHDQKLFSSTPRQFDMAKAIGFDVHAQNLDVPTRMYCYVRDKARDSMRKYLQQRGFKGMEYNGGILVGGYGLHRAFCVWDDDWVNYHKTNRYK